MHESQAKTLLINNNEINIYRGCSHGCIFCEARSAVYGMGVNFDDIEVKTNAPILLEKALKSRKEPFMIETGAMCDPYLHAENTYQLTRQCLEVVDRYEFGIAIKTKSNRILRDMDLLESINRKSKAVVEVYLSTLSDELSEKIEPQASKASERIEILKECKRRGISTIVYLSPILPFINDDEENMEAILEVCKDNEVKGIVCPSANLCLKEGNKDYFYNQLEKNFPGMKDKYLEVYKDAYELSSSKNYELMRLFRSKCREYKILHTPEDCFRFIKEFPIKDEQTSLF